MRCRLLTKLVYLFPLVLLAGCFAARPARDAFIAAPSDKGGDQRMVFAHYMVTYNLYPATVAGYSREIRQAMALGIDGWALNAGSGSGYFATDIEAIFEAAAGTPFKLFFSADPCCQIPASTIVNWMETYASSPNYFVYEGRPVLSTYGGSELSPSDGLHFWRDQVLAPIRNAGINVFFMPYFYPYPVLGSGKITDENLRASYDSWWGQIVDGIFWLGLQGLPVQQVSDGEAYARLAKRVGKPFMDGFTPEFWGQAEADRRYYEDMGGEGIATVWQDIIQNSGTQWVEIGTWNDYGESSYVTDASRSDIINLCGCGFQDEYHGAYMQLIRHYADWFRAGVEPTIDRDALFAFYRTAPMDAVAPNARPISLFVGDVLDDIYVTTELTAPATLTVTTGGSVQTFEVTGGIQHIRVPFQTGPQSFELDRDGDVITSVSGSAIASSIAQYDFSLTTVYAFGP